MRILIVLLLLISLVYLLAWPAPIEPKAWSAPIFEGLAGAHAPNERLKKMETFSFAPHFGPEDITGDAEGNIYTVSKGGELLKIDAERNISILARLGGRPLGIEPTTDGSLVVANAGVGLQLVTASGKTAVLTRKVAGTPIFYADDVAVDDDGMVYFSDASTHFDPRKFNGTFAASQLDIMEHDPNGRLLSYNPETGETEILIDKLSFANGVAVDESGTFLLVAETGAYRIWKYWLKGPKRGQKEAIAENLPGFPDNINRGQDGRFWVGLVSARIPLVDKLSDKPFIRKMVSRLPASFRPDATSSSHLIAIDGDGKVLIDLQGTDIPMNSITGAYETDTDLFVSSLVGELIGRIDKSDLGL